MPINIGICHVGLLGITIPKFPTPSVPQYVISGVSRDNTGAALGGCTCTLFNVTTDGSGVDQFTQQAAMVSDANGIFSFSVSTNGNWRVTFDLAGSPIRAGITLKTVTGV